MGRNRETRNQRKGNRSKRFFFSFSLLPSLSHCLAPWFSVREPVRDKTKRTVSLLGTILSLSPSHSVSHSLSLSACEPLSFSLSYFFGLIPFSLSFCCSSFCLMAALRFLLIPASILEPFRNPQLLTSSTVSLLLPPAHFTIKHCRLCIISTHWPSTWIGTPVPVPVLNQPIMWHQCNT